MVSATVPVTGFEKAKDFDGGTLGFEFLWEGPVSVWFRCGDSSEILIFKRPPTVTDHTLAHFEMADLEAVIRDLETKGVTFIDHTKGPLVTMGHIAQLGPARAAWIHDPDGNTLGLRQG
jgi:catechol 2,3-dioxygenase-like lactoylglutathione lyase family enzyme